MVYIATVDKPTYGDAPYVKYTNDRDCLPAEAGDIYSDVMDWPTVCSCIATDVAVGYDVTVDFGWIDHPRHFAATTGIES